MKKSQLKEIIRAIVTEVTAIKRQQLAEAKGLSGNTKASTKRPNTQMKSDDKVITSTDKPKEKKEGKKLPVKDTKKNTETKHVQKKKPTPKVPSGEKKESTVRPVGGNKFKKSLKEDSLSDNILVQMIREAIAGYNITEMAKKPISFDGKTLAGSISNSLRKQDSSSPTGWSLSVPYKMKDGTTVPAGTPVDAPSNTGKNYVPKGKPVTGGFGSEEEDEEDMQVGGNPPSKVAVVLDGKKIGDFNFRLPSGKISDDDMEANLYRLTDLAGHALDDSVQDKYNALEDMFFDDKLPANATLTLKTVRSPKGLTAAAV